MLDVKEEMYLCFIDCQKAFDSVDWTKLLEMLRNIGEYLMKEALTEVGNFKIGRRSINKVRFVDDTAIIAKT